MILNTDLQRSSMGLQNTYTYEIMLQINKIGYFNQIFNYFNQVFLYIQLIGWFNQKIYLNWPQLV